MPEHKLALQSSEEKIEKRLDKIEQYISNRKNAIKMIDTIKTCSEAFFETLRPHLENSERLGAAFKEEDEIRKMNRREKNYDCNNLYWLIEPKTI